MPGIVGIVGSPSENNEGSLLGRMIEAMMYEPFYASEKYINHALGVSVARISHLGSHTEPQPVWNATRDVCLIFSGENFEIGEISSANSSSDARNVEGLGYLLQWYEQLGDRFLEGLNGLFSGLLIDLRERKVMLFNDRFGLHRLYYHEHRTGFYFSSEAKALLKALPELREVDLVSLGETFACGCALENRTLFKNIALLPGASVWTFRQAGAIQKKRYFDPVDWEGQEPLACEDYRRRLNEVLARVIPRYLTGPHPVAMSLTGGLDGRMIMAWAHPAPGSLPCYTFGGPYRDCADVRIARRVAVLCGQSHETISVGSQFFKEFPSLAQKAVYISDGSMDVTGGVELYVNKIARTIAPIRLTGNYGSEIVRGNVAFRAHAFDRAVLDPGFSLAVQAASATYSRLRDGHPLSFIAFKQVPWYHYSRLSVEASQLTLRSPYLDNDLVSRSTRAPRELALSVEPSMRAIAEGNPRLAMVPTDRGLLYRPVPIVSKAFHVYQEFTVRAEYAYDYGMPQWVARVDHMLAPLHLERVFLGRHKFYHFRVWYRDQLSQYLKDILLDRRARTRSYVNGRVLEQVVKAHTSGQRNHTSELHRLSYRRTLSQNSDRSGVAHSLRFNTIVLCVRIRVP